ncbi:MAG: hypothetical protein R6U11_00740 [Bacteroidales bacterium]
MITLETTKKAFDAWRTTKPHTSSPVPLKLWEMVDLLLSTHKMSKVCKTLGIRYQQIRLHCKAVSLTKNQFLQPKAMNEFIEAKPPALSVGMAELTLKGEFKSLHLCLPASALCEVLPILGSLL